VSLVRLEIDVRRVTLGDECYVILGAKMPDRWLTLAELGEPGVLAELGALSRGLVYIHNVPRRRLQYAAHPLAAKLGLPQPSGSPHVRSLLHPDDLAQFGAYVAHQASAPDDRVSKGTFRVRGADGDWLWINIRSWVFARDPSGVIRRVIGVATEVSDAHNHAAALALAATAFAYAEVNERRRIGRELHDSISVKVARGMERLLFTIKIALFRVAQEAPMNVYRHAHRGGRVVLEVEDDGVGLPATGESKDLRGVGIGGMQARMTQVGGTFDLLPGAAGLKVRASVIADLRPEV
jgi:signal transduction histidine kinase